jgi:hypothetical protein
MKIVKRFCSCVGKKGARTEALSFKRQREDHITSKNFAKKRRTEEMTTIWMIDHTTGCPSALCEVTTKTGIRTINAGSKMKIR